MSRLKVNFSKNEAESQVREIAPSGEYHCKITEIESKTVNPSSKNAGKPYWNIKFNIQDPTQAHFAPLYSNIMLFEGEDGTLGSLAQFLKALGYDVTAGEFDLPEEDELMGRDINVKGVKKQAGYDRKAGKDLNERFQVNGYKPANTKVKTGNTSLLP